MSFFYSIFRAIAVFSLYGEYVVRSFLPDGVFLPCNHGLFFYISLYENSTNQLKQIILCQGRIFIHDST